MTLITGLCLIGVLLVGAAIIQSPSFNQAVQITANAVASAVSSVITKPGIKPTEKNQKNNKNNYNVYKLINPNTQEPMYVGRTNNVSATKNRHQKNEYRRGLKLIVEFPDVSYEASRGLEQMLINKLQTHKYHHSSDLKTHNQINGLSPYHKNCREYIDAAITVYFGETYVGGYDWCK